MPTAFDFTPRTRVVFGDGVFARLGELTRALGGARHVLLVADPGIRDVGYADEARRLIEAAGIAVASFHDFGPNPDSDMVERGRAFAAPLGCEAIVAVGGGSSLDCAKGISFLLTNGGRMQNYWGYARAARPLLPMIAVPTTAGTGSEAQSYALISDARSHVKMACGDPTAAFRVALLDPALTCSQPPQVTARSGYDAISHAVESYVTTKHNAMSDLFAREAWRLLAANFLRVLEAPNDRAARGAMLLGAHLAGMAIEQSMLGASHACANPLTAHFGIDHGDAIALMLPHVVAWNSVAPATAGEDIRARYAALAADVPSCRGDLADFLSALGRVADLGGTLRARGIPRDALPQLADDAATQWTGRFNPRPFDTAGAMALYESAW